jgi:hypothetical protein
MFMSVSRYHTCYTFFPRGTSLFKAALTTTFPCLPTSCINPLGWHHATDNLSPPTLFHKFRIGKVGFLLDHLPVPTETTCRSFSKRRTADTRRTAVPHSRIDWKKKFRPIRNYTTRWQLTRALRNYPALF